MESKLKCALAICAIAAICFLEHRALSLGIDGPILGLGVAAVAGLGGYSIRDIVDKLRGKDEKS